MRAWIADRKGVVIVVAAAVVLAVVAGVAIAFATGGREREPDAGVDITAEPVSPSSSTEPSTTPDEDEVTPPPQGWPDAIWDDGRWVIPCEESDTGFCELDIDTDGGEPMHEIHDTDVASDSDIELAMQFLEEWVTFSSEESRDDRFSRIEEFVAGRENFMLDDESELAVPEMGWESQYRNLVRQGFLAEVEVEGDMRVAGSEDNGYWTRVVLAVPVYAEYSTQACRRHPNVAPGCNWVREELPYTVNIVDGKVLWVVEPDFWKDNYYRFNPEQDVHGMPELPQVP